MRFLNSFAMLTLPTDCSSGCFHAYCEEIRESARRQTCAGCGSSIGLNVAFKVVGCAVHLECLAAVLCKIVGGAGLALNGVRDPSTGVPASRVDQGVAA